MKAGEALRLSLPAVLLLIGFSAWTQQSSVQAPNSTTDEVPQFSLEAKSFIDALLKVSARFQFPLGVEWVKTADTLKPVQFSRSHATVKDVIDAVVSTHAGYEWRTEDGVVHVFQRDLVNDDRNPLNIIIKSFNEFDEQGYTVGWAGTILFHKLRNVVRTPELSGFGLAASVLGYPGEPVFNFAAQNAPARKILNQIVTSGIRTIPIKMQRIWIATFPEKPVFSRTFLEVIPMDDPKFVPDQDQPFWILYGWGDTPLENMVR